MTAPVPAGPTDAQGDRLAAIEAAHTDCATTGGCTVLRLTAAVRAMLALADELEAEKGSVQGNVARLLAAQRIRAALAAADALTTTVLRDLTPTEERTRYESHTWNPTEPDDECIVCGVTWSECEGDCPGVQPARFEQWGLTDSQQRAEHLTGGGR